MNGGKVSGRPKLWGDVALFACGLVLVVGYVVMRALNIGSGDEPSVLILIGGCVPAVIGLISVLGTLQRRKRHRVGGAGE